MVMHEQNDLLEMILSNRIPEILTPDRDSNYPLPSLERDQQLDLFEMLESNNDAQMFENMDSFIDDSCSTVEEIAETVEIPSTSSPLTDASSAATADSASETQVFFQFPITAANELTTIDLGYLTGSQVGDISNETFLEDVTSTYDTTNDATDTESVYSATTVPSTPFSPTSPSYSLPPPTPDSLSTSGNVPSFVKEGLKSAIRSKRRKEGKEELVVEFVEPLPEQLTEEEEMKRTEKREKNKLAAQKCREKKRVRAETLEAETRQLQKTQNKYKLEIQKLLDEREQLMEIIKIHKTVCPRFRTQSANI